ncbi:DUF692 domain-containing protein [Pantoea sp. Ap-967]|uniref:MNIO family bufferin maturase n=1 Tax=Pantoea sp. Ap-967 TaxID=2608362 RepID=UPI001420C8F5|nr:DUF692 domain-containing protein [Pantoea sp. Ap-967]NIE77477.1 DUF692 domain-containing protein [Pantoea sp. Ap-967]
MNGQAALGAGVGLKAEHYAQALACGAEGLWFEVHPENYMVGGPRLAWLLRIAEHHPLSLHGVALSLAADAEPDRLHLQRLRALVDQAGPVLVSEHLAWSTWRGAYHPDLLPFPRTGEALRRISRNIQISQEALGRPIAIENPSHYLQLQGHDWDEIDFLEALARRTGCGLLLDINNVHVSAHNLGFDAIDYLERFPAWAISEVHLAGYSHDDQACLLIDSHDAPVAEPVWALYRRLIARVGPRPTLVERDGHVPPWAQLLNERDRAQATLNAVEVLR